MQKWAPALKISIAVLRVAAVVTRVISSLPIPIPDGQMTETDAAIAVMEGGIY